MSGRWLGPLIVLELLAGAAISWLIGEPAKVPGVALDSAVVFIAYRALVLFLAAYVVTAILIWSFTGSLASKVGTGGIEWSNKEAANTAAEEMLKLNLRLDDQQNFVHNVMARLIEDGRERESLERSVRRVEDDLTRSIRRLDDEIQRVALIADQLRRQSRG